MKKILLTLGSIAAIATPVAAVVSCSAIGEYPPSEGHKYKYLFSKPAEQAIVDAAVQALSIPRADIRSTLGGTEYKFGLLNFRYYVRMIFKVNSSFDAGNGRVNVRAQDAILIGVNESTDPGRAATEMKVFYINDEGRTTAEDLTPALIAKKKLAIFENAMKKPLEDIKRQEAQDKERESNWLIVDEIMASIIKDAPTKARVLIIKMGPGAKRPTHLPKEDIESIIKELEKLPGIDKVTEIQCFYSANQLGDDSETQTKVDGFVIKVPAGHATDFKVVSEAAATVVATVTSEHHSTSGTQPSTSGTQSSNSGSQHSNNAPQ